VTDATLQVFNTLGARLQAFEPLEPGRARIYSCGPTVYAYQHIGNMRPYVFADTLRRVLVSGRATRSPMS
jgi:cysteinyl-tRNA synthetase